MIAVMNDDDLNFTDDDFKPMKSHNLAQAWVRKIDRDHCAVTLGDYDLDSTEVQNRVAAMKAAMKSVEFFGRDARNILNEGRFIQIVWCLAYSISHFVRK